MPAPVPRGASEDHGSAAGPVPGAAGVANLRLRMVLWRYQPKRGVETAFAIAVFQPLSQMHLDIRKGIHLLSPCNNTAAIPSCLFDGKLTETTESRLAVLLLAPAAAQGWLSPFHRRARMYPLSGVPLKVLGGAETEARGSPEACVGRVGARAG